MIIILWTICVFFILCSLGHSHPCSMHIFCPHEHIFCPRGAVSCIFFYPHDLSMWPYFWIPCVDVFARHRIDLCLICSQDTAGVSSAHETQHGLLSCLPLSLAFLVRSPSHSWNEATSCGFIKLFWLVPSSWSWGEFCRNIHMSLNFWPCVGLVSMPANILPMGQDWTSISPAS